MPLAAFNLDQLASAPVLDQLAEGVIVADPQGSIRYVNSAAREMHGVDDLNVTPDQYSERYHLYTVDGKPHPFEDLPLARAVRGEEVFDAPWVIRRPDGSEVWAVGSAKPLRDDADAQIGAVLTIRDVTETTRARNELRESEETVRAFFETAGVYTAVIDVEDTDFRLMMGNQRMAAAFGVERLCGQSGRAILGEQAASEILGWLRSAQSSHEPTIVEYPWNSDGLDRWFVATITPMRNSDRRVFLASLDITSRKKMERELETALVTKDALLHEVNHRVKNSLQIITSLLKLQERMGDDVLAGHLREARSRVETVARVHERLYDTSAHDRVEIVGYLEDLLTNVVDSIGTDDAAVRYRFVHEGERVELGVEFSVPLALIVVEMAINSTKYAFPEGEGGTVTLTTRVDPQHLTLTIDDDGVGFDGTPRAKGTGLGMRIVQALSTQLHADGGYIATDRGTAFRLVMPLPETAKSPARA
ncbi:MAG: PAS domain S-box protein [Erythrobacter sp.]|nr:PAS domain S-box protein [Erythrobacter sp.]NCQ62361.1 PAS domain S-box protein [Alphaproteobacteria bacterium]